MSNLYVRVVEGAVTDVWDRAPEEGVGNNGWKNAVEVKPTIIPNRQGYTAHTFDLTKDPVEIVYGVYDISVGDRKSSMSGNANIEFQSFVQRKSANPTNMNVAEITDAHTAMMAKLDAINACTTHDELDALN
jgi:hypothetical protein